MAGETGFGMFGATAPQPTQPQGAIAGMTDFVQQLMKRMTQPQLPQVPGKPAEQAPMDQSIVRGREGKAGGKVDQFEMGQKAGTNLMAGVMQAVQQKKQRDLNNAVNDWNILLAAHERLSMAGKVGPDGKVDLMQDPLVANYFTSPEGQKKLKNMAKAFQADLLNPEKTNVHQEALKKALKLHEAKGKLQAAMQKMHLAKAKVEMTPELMRKATEEVMQRVSATARPGQADSKMATSVLSDLTREQIADANRAAMEQRLTQRLDEMHKELTEKIGAQKEITGMKLDERWKEFEITDKFRKWKAVLDSKTKLAAAKITAGKDPAMLTQMATFSRTGVSQFEKARDILHDLEKKGYLGSWMQGKVEDAIWGSGLSDPNMPEDVRRDIGELRSQIQLGNSAMLRAHTGRTSKEIYDDIRKMNRMGQDIDALYGAIDNSIDVLGDYADVLVPAQKESLHQPVKKDHSEPSKPGTVVKDKKELD